MAARLTDKQKKKIIADYLELESYSAVAKKHHIAPDTVKRCVLRCEDFARKAKHKKEQNTVDILAYMESQRKVVCEIIGKGLAELNRPEKLTIATPAQITTALGTLIDKWTSISGGTLDAGKDDELSHSLREMAGELESDD